jgi:hypothetical protein
MTTTTITQAQFITTTTQAASSLASGWSEAANRYVGWVTTQEATRVVTATERFNQFASDLGRGYQTAAQNANTWAQAAINAGDTGVGRIMQRYADNLATQASNLLNQAVDGRIRLDGIANEAKNAATRAGDVFGGNLGRVIGPAFDAAQLIAGAIDWVQTGNSDKFGGAAMGVLLSAGGGILLATLAAPFIGAGVGLAVIAGLGALIGSASGDSVFAAFRDSSFIQDLVNTLFTSAQSWQPPRDPLVLDLDGDGIETVGINPSSTSAPILFDHNADGIRSGTGWVASDDALLVRDINGNGLIDSGRELFGDNTLLADGTTLASNGFTALAQHDANSDNQINSQDAIFSQLKIWRDLNQDATSQASELQTLSQAGITSIGVQGTATNTPLVNSSGQATGNTQIAEGSFTRSNGSVGKSGVAELAGSLLLASNGFYREFTDNPTLTSTAKALPQMQGSGWARDLREAMSQTGDLSDEALALEQKVAAFAGAGERRCAQRLRAHTRTRRIHARASAQNTQSTVL